MGSNQTGSGNGSDDNVVRFPRDWLGPRDELVPFGPSAGTTTPGVDEELPRSADDFWGEQSSAVHDAVRAPNGDTPHPHGSSARGGLGGKPPWFGVRGRHVNPKLATSLAAVAVLLAGLLIGNEPGHSPTLTLSHRSAQLPGAPLRPPAHP